MIFIPMGWVTVYNAVVLTGILLTNAAVLVIVLLERRRHP